MPGTSPEARDIIYRLAAQLAGAETERASQRPARCELIELGDWLRNERWHNHDAR